MQLVIVDERTERRDNTMMAGLERNIFATATANKIVAEETLQRFPVDILVASTKTLGDDMVELLAFAEDHNPELTTILWSDDVNADLDTLSEAFPSINAVLGQQVSPKMAVQIALSGAKNAMSKIDKPDLSEGPLMLGKAHTTESPLPFSSRYQKRNVA